MGVPNLVWDTREKWVMPSLLSTGCLHGPSRAPIAPPSPLRHVDHSYTVGGRAGIGILRRYSRNEEIRGLHVRGHRSQRRCHRRAVRWPGVIHEAAEACRGDVSGRKGGRGVVVVLRVSS